MGCCCSVDKAMDKPSKSYPAFFETMPSLAGKIVAITGTTTGTGNIAAKACAQKGATVLLLNRASERSVSSLKALQEGVVGGTFVAIECDLQSMKSVREAAKQIKEQYGTQGIDVLCCNAGVMAMPDEATQDGYDVQMQTNHLSHWVLSSELWPLLVTAGERTGDARLVFHSSSARQMEKKLIPKYYGKNGGNLGGNGSSMLFLGGRWKRYCHTKLANIVCTYALADRVEKAGVTKVKVLAAEPGAAATNLQRTAGASGGMSESTTACIFTMTGQSAEDGACPLLACMANADAQNGDFYIPKGGAAGPPVKIPKREKHCNSEENKRILVEATKLNMGCDIPIEG
mmetsp:Transcript_29477/g.71015  ORF Transcript_29477/g.71015 Transcript_29477/m.71015 type:complete len:344 (+) Transcript_29477:140-1171(+)